MPTREEIESIGLITGHVADAIIYSRDPKFMARRSSGQSAEPPKLRLVSDNQASRDPAKRLLAIVEKLQLKAVDLDNHADRSESGTAAQSFREAAEISRKLAARITSEIELIRSGRRVP
jgi:hypothetical protein